MKKLYAKFAIRIAKLIFYASWVAGKSYIIFKNLVCKIEQYSYKKIIYNASNAQNLV